MEWYVGVLKKYAVFSGRARRKEYWMFALFNSIIILVLAFIDQILGSYGVVGIIYFLAVFVPSLAVTVRRLHDISRSGWWLLIGLLPLIGFIVLLVFMVLDGKSEDNNYGKSPKHQS